MRRFFLALALLLAIAGPTAGSSRSVRSANSQAAPAPMLDLPSIVLAPEDIGRAAVGPVIGAPAAEYVDPYGPLAGPAHLGLEPPAGFTDRLWAAGWRRSYESSLALPEAVPMDEMYLPVPVGPPGSGIEGAEAAVTITSRITEYDDASGAAAGLPLERADHLFYLDYREEAPLAFPLERAVGEDLEATVARYVGWEDQRTAVVTLSFRLDRLTAWIEIVDWTGGPLPTAFVTDLGSTLAARMEAALAGPAGGLGRLALRPTGDYSWPLAAEWYAVRDGRVARFYRESGADFQRRAAAFAGIEHAYVVRRLLDDHDPARATLYFALVREFGDEGAARSWFAAHAAHPIIPGVEVPADVVLDDPTPMPRSGAPGDESALVATTANVDGVVEEVRALTARAGRYGVSVVLIAPDARGLARAATDLATAQVACLERAGCADPAPLPGALAGP